MDILFLFPDSTPHTRRGLGRSAWAGEMPEVMTTMWGHGDSGWENQVQDFAAPWAGLMSLCLSLTLSESQLPHP